MDSRLLRDHLWERGPEYGQGAREDEPGPPLPGPGRLKKRPRSVKVHAHAKVEVRFCLPAHHSGEVKDHIGSLRDAAYGSVTEQVGLKQIDPTVARKRSDLRCVHQSDTLDALQLKKRESEAAPEESSSSCYGNVHFPR